MNKPHFYRRFQPLIYFAGCGYSGPPPRHFQFTDNQVKWRINKEGACRHRLNLLALLMTAAADRPQARYCRKNTTTRVGYKVHLSEICETEHPQRPGAPVDHSGYNDCQY